MKPMGLSPSASLRALIKEIIAANMIALPPVVDDLIGISSTTILMSFANREISGYPVFHRIHSKC